MEKLKEVIKLKGLGYQVTATLIKRTRWKAIYLRDDDCYEVFKIRIKPAGIVFGRQYLKREVYPGNEDFGFSAWCVRDKEKAYRRYEKL